jgi:phosphoribosyl 1,2-cyclic phosphate phosphodiesterase
MNMEEALVAAGRIAARQTYFTHLTDEYDYESTQKEMPQSIQLAWDGLRVDLE